MPNRASELEQEAKQQPICSLSTRLTNAERELAMERWRRNCCCFVVGGAGAVVLRSVECVFVRCFFMLDQSMVGIFFLFEFFW